jgi:hypothetical protein
MGPVSVKQYYEFPDLAAVYLEDSFVLAVDEASDAVSFTIDAVLTERHPEYRPPSEGERYCHRRASLIIDGATAIHWVRRGDQVFTDANNETDLGEIDAMTYQDDHYDMEGSWGNVHIFTRHPPRLVLQ